MSAVCTVIGESVMFRQCIPYDVRAGTGVVVSRRAAASGSKSSLAISASISASVGCSLGMVGVQAVAKG